MKNTSLKTNTTTMRLLISVVALILTAGLSIWGMAQDAKQDHSAHAQEMKAPQTTQEHRERAEQYQKKAAEYRKEAEALAQEADEMAKYHTMRAKEMEGK